MHRRGYGQDRTCDQGGKGEFFRPISTISQAKTGQSPDDFRRLAAEKGFADDKGLKAGVKAGQIVAWLKQDFELGHGHAMAIVALLKGRPDQNT